MGPRMDSNREPRRTALPRGPKAGVLWGQDEFAGCLPRVPSWSQAYHSAKMDSSKDSRRLVGCVASSFDLSQILPVAVGMLVPCSLSGPPVVK